MFAPIFQCFEFFDWFYYQGERYKIQFFSICFLLFVMQQVDFKTYKPEKSKPSRNLVVN